MVDVAVTAVQGGAWVADAFAVVAVGKSQQLARLKAGQVYSFQNTQGRRHAQIDILQRMNAKTFDVPEAAGECAVRRLAAKHDGAEARGFAAKAKITSSGEHVDVRFGTSISAASAKLAGDAPEVFVAVTLGKAQQLGRLSGEQHQTFRLPRPKAARGGKIELFRRVGTCYAEVDIGSAPLRQNFAIECRKAGLGGLRLQVRVGLFGMAAKLHALAAKDGQAPQQENREQQLRHPERPQPQQEQPRLTQQLHPRQERTQQEAQTSQTPQKPQQEQQQQQQPQQLPVRTPAPLLKPPQAQKQQEQQPPGHRPPMQPRPEQPDRPPQPDMAGGGAAACRGAWALSAGQGSDIDLEGPCRGGAAGRVTLDLDDRPEPQAAQEGCDEGSVLSLTSCTPSPQAMSLSLTTPPKVAALGERPAVQGGEETLRPRCSVRRSSAEGLSRGRTQRLSFMLLAISVTMPGRNFPVWKVAINAQNRLRDVLLRWANDKLGHRGAGASLPDGMQALAGLGGPVLDVTQKLSVLRNILPVVDARHTVCVTLPAPPEAEAERRRAGGGSAASSGRGALGKLRISTRYADVDRDSMGFHTSTTMKAKIEAGVYNWTGQFSQTAFNEAMRTPPDFDNLELMLESRELLVFPERNSQGSAGPRAADQEPLFRATLRGPEDLIANWEATCDRFAATAPDSKVLQRTPYPVFIPTKGRADRSNLNWHAEHVYGPREPAETSGVQPVVCVVVEPHEEDYYRDVWPMALMLILPDSGRGPGFARWVVQRVCTRAYVDLGQSEAPGRPSGSRLQMRQIPYVWIADDSISMFYSLVPLGANAEQTYISERSGAQRLKERQAPEGAPMFRRAFTTVQKHPFIARAAVAGFLRDDGTAVCKRMDWKSDELSLYKIVLLNLQELRRLGVEYQRDLMMYEDICLVHQVLRLGGHTLKCQSFCFWAAHSASGGCHEQRKSKSEAGTSLFDLMAPAAFRKLCASHQETVQELHTWVRSKEKLSIFKGGAEKKPNGMVTSSASKEPQAAPKRPRNKAERDSQAEHKKRKKRKLDHKAKEREEQSAKGLPPSPARASGRGRRRPAGIDEEGAGNSSSDGESGSGSSTSSSSSSKELDDESIGAAPVDA